MATEVTTTQISFEDFRGGLLIILEEIFEKVHNYVLDDDTSLFETLAGVSAEEASKPISSQCASIAAQVNHTRFYIDVIMKGVQDGFEEKADWDGSWKVGPVDDAEWQALIERLRVSYQALRTFAAENETWNENFIGGAFANVAHAAYHLGEIRQGLGVLRGGRDRDLRNIE